MFHNPSQEIRAFARAICHADKVLMRLWAFLEDDPGAATRGPYADWVSKTSREIIDFVFEDDDLLAAVREATGTVAMMRHGFELDRIAGEIAAELQGIGEDYGLEDYDRSPPGLRTATALLTVAKELVRADLAARHADEEDFC